jgi:hypothetical protein
MCGHAFVWRGMYHVGMWSSVQIGPDTKRDVSWRRDRGVGDGRYGKTEHDHYSVNSSSRRGSDLIQEPDLCPLVLAMLIVVGAAVVAVVVFVVGGSALARQRESRTGREHSGTSESKSFRYVMICSWSCTDACGSSSLSNSFARTDICGREEWSGVRVGDEHWSIRAA